MDSFLNPVNNPFPFFSMDPSDWGKPEGFTEDGTPCRWLNAKVSGVYLGLDPDPVMHGTSSLVFAIRFLTEDAGEAVIEMPLATFQPEQMLYAGVSNTPEAFQKAKTAYDIRPVDLIRQLLELTGCKQVGDMEGRILKIQVLDTGIATVQPTITAIADPIHYKHERISVDRLDTINRLIENSRRAAEPFERAARRAEQYRISQREKELRSRPGFSDDPEELKKAESELRLLDAVYDPETTEPLFGIIVDEDKPTEAARDPDQHENDPSQE